MNSFLVLKEKIELVFTFVQQKWYKSWSTSLGQQTVFRKEALFDQVNAIFKIKFIRFTNSSNSRFITRASNTDTEFRYSGIELNTEFRYWKLGNSGFLEAKNGHFWPNFGQILQQNVIFEPILIRTISDK